MGSTIEVVNYEGGDQKRSLDLDWRLVIGEKNSANGTKETRSRVLKIRIERQGKTVEDHGAGAGGAPWE